MTSYSIFLIIGFYTFLIISWVYGITSESSVHGFYLFFIICFFLVLLDFIKVKAAHHSLKKQNFTDDEYKRLQKEELKRLKKGDKDSPGIESYYLHLGFQLFLLISYYVLT